MKKISYCYGKRFPKKLKEFNKKFPIADYIRDLIGDKKEVKIADLGSGPISTTGNYLEGVKIDLYPSDILDYSILWEREDAVPLIPIEIQDMENLTYEDEFFDIVLCINVLDHLEDVKKVIDEMTRVCKKGGIIYLRHHKGQKKLYPRRHFWNMEEIVIEGFKTLVTDTEIISTKQC